MVVCEFDSFAPPRKYNIDNVDFHLRAKKFNMVLYIFHYLILLTRWTWKCPLEPATPM